MRDLPIVAKVLLNIFLYILYVVVFSLVFSLLFPLVMNLLTGRTLNPDTQLFTNIQYFIAILVLLISLILRKYFYIWAAQKLQTHNIETQSYTAKKKPLKSPKAKKNTAVEEKISQEESDEDEIKIYVEKEIK